jgi:alpha-galactosidase
VPTNFAVEVWGYASKRGIQAIQTGGLPPMALAYLIRDRVVPVEIELAAYANHDRKLLLELIRLDPWTRSEAQASAFLDDLLALPFHTEMRKHYQ